MLKNLLIALRATAILALLTGLIFPLVITALSQAIFAKQANGSLIEKDGKVIGSALIAQPFASPKYFHPRPSAAGSGYAGEASGGTNLGPTSSKLILGTPDDPATKDVNESFPGVKQLAEQYRAENGLDPNQLVPIDAVTRSASGLDPDISVANAMLQVKRVAKARGIADENIRQLVVAHTQGRDLGFLGEPRINVLSLNLALDEKKE